MNFGWEIFKMKFLQHQKAKWYASVGILYQEALKEEAVLCYYVAFIKSTKAVCITNEHNFIAIFHHPHKYVNYFLTLLSYRIVPYVNITNFPHYM